MTEATLYTDGGARGNPGPAGIGFVLTLGGETVITHKEYIGETTNNQAEYRALLAGLKRALDEGGHELACYLDSELIVRQLTGVYRVKEKGLQNLFVQVQELRRRFDRITFHAIPRTKNKAADKLVNQAIDERT